MSRPDRISLALLDQTIEVDCPSRAVRASVLRAAALLEVDIIGREPDLHYQFRLQQEVGRPAMPRSEPLSFSAARDFTIHDEDGELLIVVEKRSLARCDLESGTVECLVHPDHESNSWIIGHRLFYLPLIEWMRKRGHFPLHGAGFLVDQRGVVVSGMSGSGKSTSALSAIMSGCPLISDDTLFLSRSDEGIVMDAFPEPVKIGRGSQRFFPEWGKRFTSEMGKLILEEADLPGGGRRGGVAPSLLLFPEVVTEPRTTFEPVTKEEALIRLIPQSVLPAAKELVQNHIDVLGEMVDGVQPYRLLFGGDARSLADRIREDLL